MALQPFVATDFRENPYRDIRDVLAENHIPMPDGTIPVITCEVELPGSPITRQYTSQGNKYRPTVVEVHLFGDYVFAGYARWTRDQRKSVVEEVPFAKATLISKAYTRAEEPRYGSKVGPSEYDDPSAPISTYGFHYQRQNHQLHHAWLKYRITLDDGTEFELEKGFELPTTGKATVEANGAITCVVDFHGRHHIWSHENLLGYSRGGYYNTSSWDVFAPHLRSSELVGGVDHWWSVFLSNKGTAKNPDMKGLSNIVKRNADCFATLAGDHPNAWAFLCWLTSSRSFEGNVNNKLLGAFFADCGFDPQRIAAETLKVRESVPVDVGYISETNEYIGVRQGFCKLFPSSQEVIRAAAAKTDFRKALGNEAKADTLEITEAEYPMLRAAVIAGEIPASVFANPDGTPINREYALWERALGQKDWAAPIYKIAQDAGRRSTYEKDVTPYLAFLFKLGPYLDRHTPGRKKWSCFPSYVESEWQLEMGGEDGGGPSENGTVKRRSAFTPVADNDTRVVTVPYVAVCVTGVRSQWCYSKEYYVFEEMMIDPISKGVVVNEIEEKLNGRDDYGLMFYTLNGTATAQGYPTFLIIFERRTQQNDTFVHFHRVHPKRKADGKWTPACKLIETVYQYMAGNVPATEVTAQQGDMIYIGLGNDPIAAGVSVDPNPVSGPALNFESHKHMALNGGKVHLHLSTAKTPKNRLGFIEVPEGGMAVRHPEHDDIEYLKPGWYEVRRCRSWEANPKAIWSLTID